MPQVTIIRLGAYAHRSRLDPGYYQKTVSQYVTSWTRRRCVLGTLKFATALPHCNSMRLYKGNKPVYY